MLTSSPEFYTLSLHDALPILARPAVLLAEQPREGRAVFVHEAPLLPDAPVPQLGERLGHLHRQPVREQVRSEEHTSELQSLRHLVCRLLLEKKNKKNTTVKPN